MTRTSCAAIVMLLAGTTFGDVVVPNAAAGVEGDATFALTSTAVAGRTYQLTIDSAQLTGLVGQNITGLQWRLNGPGTAAWPSVNTTYASWDVFVGPGVDPSAMSNTFASNFTGATTQVRSGAYAFAANSFTFGSSPNTFGATLDFTTPYLYTGGDLTIEMRFAAQAGATNQPVFDAVAASGGPANGWGVDFSARWTGNVAGTSGSNGNFLVTNFIAAAGAVCYPNCDHSTVPPVLNVQDFSCFLNSFATGETYANCDLSTTPPVLNVQDFSCFLNAFASGCS